AAGGGAAGAAAAAAARGGRDLRRQDPPGGPRARLEQTAGGAAQPDPRPFAAHRRPRRAARAAGHHLARAAGGREARSGRGAAGRAAPHELRRVPARAPLMAWWYGVVESRHELQHPTSPEKIRLLGEAVGLRDGSRMLDIGGGRGGPAVLLAREFGCRITSVEQSPEFVAAARERAEAAGVAHLVEVVESDAKDFAAAPAGYDAALCLGASFAYGGLAPTVEALAQAVPPRGHVAVG